MVTFTRGTSLLVVSFFYLTYSERLEEQNIALGKPTWQYPPGFGPSVRAVDGNTDPDFGQNSCTHTTDKQSKEPAIWSVDLIYEFHITGIKIYNRQNLKKRLRHFQLHGNPGNVMLYDDATESPQYMNNEIYVPVGSDQRFSNITVYLPTIEGQNTILTLCEVQIFGRGCRVPDLYCGFFTDAGKHQLNISGMIVPSGTMIHASCSTGYRFSAEDNSLTCGQNYMWDKSDPKCTVITCARLTLENGIYVFNESDPDVFYAFGSVFTAQCDNGFELHGTRQRTCLANESWSGADPQCTVVVCEYQRGFDNWHYANYNSKLNAQEIAIYNTTIQAVCEKGYILASVQINHRCAEHSNWTDSTPSCHPITCGESENTASATFRKLNVTNGTYPEYRSIVKWTCDGNHYIVAGTQTCTEHGIWSWTPPSCQEYKSGESGLVGAIAGIFGCVMALVFVVLVILIVFKKRKTSVNRINRYDRTTFTTNTEYVNSRVTPTSEAGAEVVHEYSTTGSDGFTNGHEYYSFTTTKELPEQAILVENLSGVVFTGCLVSVEFKDQFQFLPTGLIKEHKVARKVENKTKNRYKNLFPYDENRVILTQSSTNNTDYINANHVHGFNRPHAYIATQGPLPNTLNDFWEMVWQNECGKIVMLTNLVEKEKSKCEQYWPDDGSLKFGDVTVRLVDTEFFSEFILRTLALHKDKFTERLVVQFHFTAWPDKGVPKFASSIVHFWNKVKHSRSSFNGPIVVHCSAGVGRTGTYIALDYLADQALSLGYVDVVSCVKALRNQRVNLVQTLDQYIFVHHALVEALMLSTSALPAVKFPGAYRELLQIDPVTQKRNLTLAFEMLKKMSPVPDEYQYVTAKDIANRKKNRYNNILPVAEFMPNLSGTDQLETDYINAVYLPSYKEKNAFIVTQLPLESTKLDFWRLVYEHDVHTIVMLNDVSQAKKAEIYWPEDDQTVVFGYNAIQNLATEKLGSHRVVRLQMSTHDKTRTIKQFQCGGWKPGATVPDSPSCILLLLELVQAWQQRSGNHPVIVHCMDGAERSGLYCVISAVLERMKVEQDVAISHVIEEMRNRREQIICSEVQFQFCHETVLSFMEQHDTYSNFNA